MSSVLEVEQSGFFSVDELLKTIGTKWLGWYHDPARVSKFPSLDYRIFMAASSALMSSLIPWVDYPVHQTAVPKSDIRIHREYGS